MLAQDAETFAQIWADTQAFARASQLRAGPADASRVTDSLLLHEDYISRVIARMPSPLGTGPTEADLTEGYAGLLRTSGGNTTRTVFLMPAAE